MAQTTEPTFTSRSTVELYRASADNLDVARAAWVSQDAAAHAKEAEDGRVEGLIRFLWRNRHTSPFEHGQFTFVVTTPLFVAREFMRHRTFSFNEISGRYTELPDVFYVPPADRPLRQEGKVGSYRFEPGTEAQATLVRDTIIDSTRRALGLPAVARRRHCARGCPGRASGQPDDQLLGDDQPAKPHAFPRPRPHPARGQGCRERVSCLLHRADPDTIDNLSDWLTTVESRVCLGFLQSRRVRGEETVPPEEEGSAGIAEGEPEAHAVQDDSVNAALLTALVAPDGAPDLDPRLSGTYAVLPVSAAGFAARSWHSPAV